MNWKNGALASACAAALALVFATGASAGTMPVKQLLKKADAICKPDEAKLAKLPELPLWALNPAKATHYEVKLSAPTFAKSLALNKHEAALMFAVGTPSEPAAAKAWKRLHVMIYDIGFPISEDIAAAAKRGDGKAIAADFNKLTRYGPESEKLAKTLDFKVCGKNG
jgi:hypothetical protein